LNGSRFRIIGLLVVALAGCGGQDVTQSSAPAYEMAADAPTAAGGKAADAAAASSTPEQADGTSGLYLAYEHQFAVELPAGAVLTLQQRHADACRARGPAQCMVIGANANKDRDGEFVQANLVLRMRPESVPAFQKSLSTDVAEADGTILSSGVTSEDLTRAIVDTEARLTAQTKLRDRLIALLDRPTAKVNDLLEVERELARVQSEIESATSVLKVYRQRVDLSLVTLDYRSERSPVTGGVFESTRQAFLDFFRIISESLAAIIRLTAAFLPWIPILLLAGWSIRWLWRRLRRPAT
jgi:Domain of unknown function (DUF4349)